MTIHDTKMIRGSGGKSASAKDDANTRRSKATATFTEVLCEGEILGLVNNEQGIRLDDTPLVNSAGDRNFKGVSWEMRMGLPLQTPFPGDGIVTETDVNAIVKYGVPITRTLVNENYTSARVTIRFPAQFRSTDEGVKAAGVAFKIEVRPYNGAWSAPLGETHLWEKNTSPYDKSYRFKLPKNVFSGSSPWEVRVTRLIEDSKDEKVQNEIYFAVLSGIIEEKLSYPDTAMVQMTVDAEQFGSSLSRRTYEIYGRIIEVPSNYDPDTRTYSGIWDGTFKRAYSNNPAWIYRDLILNKRFGLGNYVAVQNVDKWTLYEIGKYCDQPVRSGFVNDLGQEIMEPRFTMNAVIEEEYEAYDLLQLLSSAFRGMSYWASGTVTATQDRPKEPILLVTPSNVLDGTFEYTSSALKARHTVAEVTWNDMSDLGREAVEVVRDVEGVIRYGERPKKVEAFGCTSRGQAHRLGQWILNSDMNETQVLTYKAGLDHSFLRPGDVIAVADPEIAGVSYGGRLLEGTTTTSFVLDRPVLIEGSKTYSLLVTLPEGKVETLAVLRERLGDVSVLRTATGATVAPLPGAEWVLAASDVNPKPFQITSIREESPHTYSVAAIENDVTKYPRIDYGIIFDAPPTRRETAPVPPTDLTAIESRFYKNGVPTDVITFSWKADVTALTSNFYVEVDMPDGTTQTFAPVRGTTIDIPDVIQGLYNLRVASLGVKNARSDFASLQFQAEGWIGSDMPLVRDLRILENDDNGEFNTADVTLTWRNVFPSGGGANNLMYAYNTVKVYDITDRDKPFLLREEQVQGVTYKYTIAMNAADNAKRAQLPKRRLRFAVTLTDTYHRTSDEAFVAGYNPPLPVPPITVQAGAQQIFVAWRMSEEPDYQATKVWIEDNPDYDPYTTVAKYNAKGGAYSHPANEIKTYFVRVGSYDTFGEGDMLFSSVVEVTPFAASIDLEPPKVPTGLMLQSALEGDGKAKVTATWNANDEEDLLQYQLLISLNDDEYIAIPVGSNRYEFTVFPGTKILARIRAYDQMGNGSVPSDPPIEHIAARDTVPPPVPKNVKVSASFKSLWVTWDEVPAEDLNYYRIALMPVEGVPAADYAGFYTATANTLAVLGLTTGQKFYIYVSAVDTSRNVSDWSDMVVGETVGLFEGEIAITAPVAVDHIPPPPYTGDSPLKIFDRETLKFYTLHNGEYVEENDAKLLTGTMSGKLIEALSIGRDQIGRNAISSTKITPRAVRTPLLATKAVRTRTIASGSVIADKIGAGSVEAIHVAANAIVADNISAGSVGAVHLKAEELITLKAQIADAIIDDAKIVSLDAAKLKAFSVLAETITVSNRSLGTISSDAATGAQDPAGRVNSGTTMIDAGRIVISGPPTGPGGISITSIFTGGDKTLIDGKRIAARTIQANTAVFGLQNLILSGIEFEHNKPSANQLSWTSGAIGYVDDNNVTVTGQISAGSATWTTGTLYVYFKIGSGVLQTSTNIATLTTDPTIAVLASYKGNADLVAQFGRTIIEGGKIKTGTVQADQIGATAIQTRHLSVGLISGDYIQANSLDAKKILAKESITTDQLAARSISADKIRLGDITGNLLADRILSDTKFPIGGLDGGSIIKDRSIWGAFKLAADSISGTEIGPEQISSPKIYAKTILAKNIAASTLTGDLLAANTITADKIGAREIVADRIKAGTILADNIAGNQITNFTYGTGSTGVINSQGGIIVLIYWINDTLASSTGTPNSLQFVVNIHDRQVLNVTHPYFLSYSRADSGNQQGSSTYQVDSSGICFYTGAPVGQPGIACYAPRGSYRWMAMNFSR